MARYKYRRRGEESVKNRRQEVQGGQFDSYIRDDIKLYSPKAGDRMIRILPPPSGTPPKWMTRWDDGRYEHYGIDLHVHYNVGPDKIGYACPAKMLGKPCPVCEEQERAQRAGESDDYIHELRATRRVLFFLVDRDDEGEGVQAWAAPWTIDRDIVALMVDSRSGEVLYIDDPEDGYDVEFERKGTGLKTEYVGLRIARRSTELGSGKWLDYIEENPLGDVVQFFDYDHMKAALEGRSTRKSEKDEDDDRSSSRSRSRSRDEDEDEPPPRRNRPRDEDEEDRSRRDTAKDEPEYTWEEVHDMSFRGLSRVVRQEGLKINADDFDKDEELADEICAALDISRPRRNRPRDEDDDDEGTSRSRARSRLREERD